MRCLLRALIAALASAPLLAGAATVVVENNTPDTTGSTNISGSFTPATGALNVVGVCATGTLDAAITATSSVGGQTYSRYATYGYGANHQFILFVADQLATNVSQTVTITAPTDDWSGTNIMVASIEGLTRTGLGAILQAAPEDGFGAAATPDLTFTSSVLTANPTILFACNLTNPAGLTPPTNWTEGGDIGYTSVDAGGEWAYRNSGFTGTGITWGSTSASAGKAFGFEFDTSAVGGGEPTFDSGPTVAALDADTYRVTYNASANADNIFVAVLFKNSAACSCNNIEANTCAGEINYATEATTGSADTIDVNVTLPSGDPLALNDLYICLEDGTADSTVASALDAPLAAPSGYQYVTITDPTPPVGTDGLLDGASPAAVAGDSIMAPTTVDSFNNPSANYALTLNADTTYVVAAGGDLSRVLITRRFADYSLGAWSDTTPGPTLAVNNLQAVFICIDPEDLLFEKDASVSLALDECWNDPEADTTTHAGTNLPPGGSITGSEILEGPFTTYGNFTTVELEATDQYNLAVETTVTIMVGLVLPDASAWIIDPTTDMFAANDSFFQQAMGYGR